MPLSRKDFLSLLMEVKPALAGKNDIVGLDSIWFLERSVHAYNGVIQLRVPEGLAYAISGGIPGDLVINFLKSCATDEIDIDLGQAVTFSAGKAKLKVAVLGPDKSACEFPDIDAKELGVKIDGEFTKRIERALVSVNKNSSREAYSGVLIEAADKGINIYSTDSKSICWEGMEHESFSEWENKLLLPGEFCAQLLRVADDDTYFLADEGFASVTTSEALSLTTRLLDTDGAPRFATLLRRHLGELDKYYPIPPALRGAIERVELVKPDRGEDPMVLSIKDGVMNITINTPIGIANDQVETEHPEIRVVLDSSLVLRALPNYREFAITKDCLVLHGEDTSYHLISTLQD